LKETRWVHFNRRDVWLLVWYESKVKKFNNGWSNGKGRLQKRLLGKK
jgi:hypothetical protein